MGVTSPWVMLELDDFYIGESKNVGDWLVLDYLGKW